MPNRGNQRLGPLVALPGLLARYGSSLEAVIEGLDVDPAIFANPDAAIEMTTACRIMERAVALTGRRSLALEIGLAQDHRNLGVIGQLMERSQTLGDAILDFVRNQHRNSRSAAAFLMPHPNGQKVGFGLYERFERGAEHIYDMAIGVGVNLVRSLAGPRAGPAAVLLCHRGNIPLSQYEALFGCPVLLNQPCAAIVITDEALKLPLPGADAVLHERLETMVEAAILVDAPDFAGQVRHLLKPSLLLGDASAERIADKVGLHIRTLNRRLQEEGTSFRAIEQSVRFAVACELLSLTQLDIGEISAALSYGTPSAFDRAFRRWTGLSPTAWRARSSMPSP